MSEKKQEKRIEERHCTELDLEAEDVGPIAAAFTKEIKPIVDQMREKCVELNIPFFTSFVLDRRDDLGGVASANLIYYGAVGEDDKPRDEDRALPMSKLARVVIDGWQPLPPQMAANAVRAEAAKKALEPVLREVLSRHTDCDCEMCQAARGAQDARDKDLIN